MMRTSALLPLSIIAAAVAGCSPSSQPAAPQTRNATTATPPEARATPATPAAVTDTHIKPTPGVPKTFGDWAVGCDNGLRCTLAALLPEDGFPSEPGSPITLNITREPGPAGAVSVKIATDNAQAAQPASFAVDGKPTALRDAAGLAAAMANGTTLTVHGADNRTLATLSLKGAAAALRYVDAQQGRVGSTNAIVAKGPAPSRAPTPPLPAIAAIAPSGTAAKLTAAQIGTLRKRAACNAEGFTPETHALGGGKSLVIFPCSTGAYNLISALFIVDGAGITPAQFDAPAGFEATGADSGTPVKSVINGAFENGVLTSDAKGRGLGDCGVHQRFVWDGTRFRLSEQSQMRECRGNADFITTWRARVIRP
ncbi:uncharacterized protein DUF1176 [Sphingomonas sp. PP-F2F-G114-C0414]|uniref:DUF1176 domain-containing protein n=1 Tax=Sphingomonas sp. PP-F2F-G114-C0414 TaxID=2135662 RepID=UPI000EF96284|nr:DUF1176 domain-containing protein [Sphingomonas sp. PP-F2F-G114-C0414]RMB36724.1 uncharacterized protein DUF1176 [Sphingomonas sp. PP-F2F-G114-C0414]